MPPWRSPQPLTGALAAVSLFQGVTLETLETLEQHGTHRRLEAGSWLFRQGDEADALYILIAGRLRVIVEAEEGPRVARELGPGAALGELAVLTGSPRSAGVQALRDSTLLAIDRDVFAAMLDEDIGLAQSIAVELARQLQASGGLVEPETRPRVLSVIPGSSALDAERFAEALSVELQRSGSVAVLRGAEPADDWPDVLARMEAEFEHVILVSAAGSARRDWAEFAGRHADRTLFLVDGETPISGGTVTDLVVLAPIPTTVTAAWLDALGPTTHHLVYDAAYEVGVARVARRVSGRSLGLVLSGGGARGFAHIGAIRAFTEAGFDIDRLGGCSMGAFIAAMTAIGLDADQIRERCHEELVQKAPFNDWTIPRVALMRSQKAERMLRRVFAELQVEELPRPLFTVSADLLSSQVVVHRRGPLVDAVGISMSIPGLVPPVPRQGRLLVDGGVLNNLPVDLMHDLPEGPIVAIDVIRRVRPGDGEPRIPSIMETMSRATILGSAERAERNRDLATLAVIPDVQGVGLREFDALDRAIAAGYEATMVALEAGGADELRAALRC